MNGAKEFLLVCVVFLVISCLTSAQPASTEGAKLSDVYDELRKKEQPVRGGGGEVEEAVNLHSDWDGSKGSQRVERSVKYMPYLDMFKEKVNQKAIRSPSLRLRFGRRSDPDFPPNFDLLNEEFQQEEPNNQQMLPPAMEYHHRQPQLQSRYLGFAREERKPARLRWGRSAPGQFSSARDQVMDTMEAMARAQRSNKQSRLRWGRSSPMTYNNDLKDLSDNELATLAIQYLINNQHQQDQYSEDDSRQSAEEDSTGKTN